MNRNEYVALHKRLWRRYGRAATHPCAMCGGQAREWANISGEYLDEEDFLPMCRPCHIEFDDPTHEVQRRAGLRGGRLGGLRRFELHGSPATIESCRKGGLARHGITT